MNKPNQLKRGQAISFRIPSDTPDHLLKHLQNLKDMERRNFSSRIAEFVMQGLGQSISREREVVTIPLPRGLTKAQRNWLKHEHSEALLGSIVYQLLTDPLRATSLLASLNSNSLDLDDALHLQDEIDLEKADEVGVNNDLEETTSSDGADADLDSFTLERLKEDPIMEKAEKEEPTDDDLHSLLGDFLAEMNK